MKAIQIFAVIFVSLVLNACSTLTAALKAGPVENTEFVAQALAAQDAVALPSERIPFHRAWRPVSAKLPRSEATQVWVAPVDVTQVLRKRAPHELPRISNDVAEVAKYMRERVGSEFQKEGYEVVIDRPAQGLVIELALIEMSATDIARNFLGTVLGAFFPGGGLVAIRSSGSTGIEGIVRDAESDKPLFMFADRERGKTTLFSLNDFTRYAHARAAIDDWANQLGRYLALPEGSRVPDSSALALLEL